MRFYLLLLTSLVLGSCQQNDYQQICENLEGTWEAKFPNGEVFFQEKWWVDNYQFLGKGERFEDGESRFIEQLELKEDGDEIYYVVKGVNPTPTSFLVTKSSPNFFLAENKENDFPKFIEYHLAKDSIVAKVYGGNDTLRFHLYRSK